MFFQSEGWLVNFTSVGSTNVMSSEEDQVQPVVEKRMTMMVTVLLKFVNGVLIYICMFCLYGEFF